MKTKEVVKWLKDKGFQPVPTKNNHVKFKHNDGRLVVFSVNHTDEYGPNFIKCLERQMKRG